MNHEKKTGRTPLLIGIAISIAMILTAFFVYDNWIDETPMLNVGTNVWTGYEPLYVARDQGLFDRRKIKLIEYSSATQVIRAIRNGLIHAAALTFDEVLLLRESGIDMKIIALVDFSKGGDAVLAAPEFAVKSGPGARKIGVESTAVGALVFSRFLEKKGINRSDLTVVPLEIEEHEQALVSGRVDAVVTFDPVVSRLRARGFLEIFSSRDIPLEVIDVLVVRADVISQQREHLARLIGAHFDGVEYVRAFPEKALEIMKGRLRLEPSEIASLLLGIELLGLEENKKHLFDHPEAFIANGRNIERIMRENGILHEKIEVSSLFDRQVLTGLYEKISRTGTVKGRVAL